MSTENQRIEKIVVTAWIDDHGEVLRGFFQRIFQKRYDDSLHLSFAPQT
jgi:hypothetical protein